jgi:hypothetical protein
LAISRDEAKDHLARATEMTEADLVWNRACTGNGGVSPRAGDRALVAMIAAHGLVMNGGVLHAIEVLEERAFIDAQSGYKYFEFNEIANLLARAKELSQAGIDIETFEPQLDVQYNRQIPDDSALTERFASLFSRIPTDFAPL